MSNRKLNLTILIYVFVVIVILFLSYFYNNWKILIGGTGVFSILMYYIFVKLKKSDDQ